jgi:hypothetical protein
MSSSLITKANKLVQKFDEFLKKNSKRAGIHPQKLEKTVRSYIDEEIIQSEDPPKKLKKMDQYDMNIYYQLNLLRDMTSHRPSSKRDIRKMLHPSLEEKQLPPETEDMVGTKAKLSNMFKKKIKVKINPKYYTRFGEFKKMPPTNLDVPVIRNSSPYISEEELYRRQYLEGKKKWVVPDKFKTYFGKASSDGSSNYIPNYVTITPSEPPILHKFRDMEKEKWIDKNFKF